MERRGMRRIFNCSTVIVLQSSCYWYRSIKRLHYLCYTCLQWNMILYNSGNVVNIFTFNLRAANNVMPFLIYNKTIEKVNADFIPSLINSIDIFWTLITLSIITLELSVATLNRAGSYQGNLQDSEARTETQVNIA